MLLKNNKVSVVIPVYNGSNYLREAIDSVLRQSYKDIEIIVINDGSTDNGKTEAIALSYVDKIRYFKKKNGGVSTALNLGIEKMCGEYFVWLSHDDVFLVDNIQIQMDYLQGRKNIVSACKTGSIINSKIKTPSASDKIVIYNKPIDYWKTWIYACSLVIPINIIKSIGGLNNCNRTTQDVEMTWAILKKFEIHFIDKPLVLRRVHDEQGFNRLQNENIQDGYELLTRIISTYGIEYFINDNFNNNKSLRVKTYLYLAWEHQKDRRKISNPFPSYLLKKCIEDWKSPFNLCLWFIKFPKLFKFLVWRTHDLNRLGSFIKRRILNV